MIKNEHQYRVTQYWVERFSQAITSLRQNEEKREKDPDGWQLLQDSHQSQLNALREEITEYETLTAHDPNQPVRLTITEINKLSDVLIKARIALKLSQKELGYLCDACGSDYVLRTEEEIKQYEAADYQNASFVDVLAVSYALGIKIQEGVFIAELDDFYKSRLAEVSGAQLAQQIMVSP